ncbi:MAG: IPT/TIG domain-containing protein [Edaphobacter sp.]
MSRATRCLTTILLATLVFSSYAFASATGAVTITGTEHSPSPGVWDSGTITVSVNSYTETVPYGQYSTPDSIASAIAAKFSSDCHGPTNAKSAPGGRINFQFKGTSTLTQLSVTGSSGSSFAGTINTPPPPPPSGPQITGVSLNQGPVQMGFVITGTGFGTNPTVTVGGVTATIVGTPTAIQITAQVPNGAGSGGVVVKVNNISSNTWAFTVTPPFGCGT